MLRVYRERLDGPDRSAWSSLWPQPPPPLTPRHISSPPKKLAVEPSDSITSSSPNHHPPGVKTLSSFLDIDKAKDLPSREIEALWRLRHAPSKQSLCATIPAQIYTTMAQMAKRHPQFIVPGLPQSQKSQVKDADECSSASREGESPAASRFDGAAIHFLQWTFPSPTTATVLFTHLSEYKLRGEHAQPHTTLTHHLEMAESKGLVLCQGMVLPDRGVDMEEAKWLVLQLQKFYDIGESAEKAEEEKYSQVGGELKRRRRRLVEKFSRGDPSFKVEELLEEAERLG